VKLRKEIFGKRSSEWVISSTIAAQIGAMLGVKVAPLVAIVAMALIALRKIGKDALCAGKEWDVTLRPDHVPPKPKSTKKQTTKRGVKK
jgi:hypothetical protein